MKTSKWIMRALIGLAVLVGLQACGGDNEIRVGLLMGDSNQERWQQDQTFFVNKVQELGGVALVKDAANDPGRQVEQAKQLISDGVKVLVVVPVDAEAAGEVVQVAHEAGVKVLAYDRIITNAPLDYYISFDNVKVGELQARYVIKEVPEGNYMILSGPTSDNNSLMFKKGQLNVLQESIDAGKINVVFDQHVGEWNREAAYDLTIQALDNMTDTIQVILAANDDLANGVRIALRERGMLGQVLVTGQDADLSACKAILRGEQAMTVYKPVQSLAHSAAIAAVNLSRHGTANGLDHKVNNGSVDVPSILLEPMPIDEENMRSIIIGDGFHVESQLYGTATEDDSGQ